MTQRMGYFAAGGGGAGGPSHGFIGHEVDTGSSTTYTFSDVDLSAFGGERYLVIFVHGDQNSNRSVSSITVGGISPLSTLNNTTGNTVCSAFIFDLTEAVVADIVVQFNNGMRRCGLVIYGIAGVNPVPHEVSRFAASQTTIVQSADTVEGGIMLNGPTLTNETVTFETSQNCVEDLDAPTGGLRSGGFSEAVTPAASGRSYDLGLSTSRGYVSVITTWAPV